MTNFIAFALYFIPQIMDEQIKKLVEQYEQLIETGEPFYMDGSTLMDIEEYYEKNGNTYEAEQVMRLAHKLHPDNAEVNTVRAYRLKARGKWSEAETIIADIPDQNAREVQLFWAEWFAAENNPDKAEAIVKKNLPETHTDERWDWYLDLSEIFFDYGFYQRTSHWLEQIPSTYSLRTRVDELLGNTYYQLQAFEKSIEAFTRLTDADPCNALGWTMLADASQKNGNLEECNTYCDYALAIDCQSVHAMGLKLFATFGTNKYDEGIELYQEFANKMPDDYVIRMYAGEQLLARGNYANALEPLQEAFRLCPLENPDRARLISDQLYTLANLKQFDKAIEVMHILASQGNPNATSYYHLADIFFETGNPKEAVQMLEKYLTASICEEKDYVNIIQMLIANKCLAPAATIWNKLGNICFSEEFAYIYLHLAYAFREMQNPILYVQSIQQALEQGTLLGYKRLKEFYQVSSADEVLAYAISESRTWISDNSTGSHKASDSAS